MIYNIGGTNLVIVNHKLGFYKITNITVGIIIIAVKL